MPGDVKVGVGNGGAYKLLAEQGDGSVAEVVVLGSSIARTVPVTVVPTISTSLYTSGDQIGGLMTLANAARYDGGGFTLNTISIVDLAKQNAEIDVILFDAAVTANNDNDPWDMSDADMAHCRGYAKVSASDYVNGADYSIACVRAVGLSTAPASGTTMYAVAVVRSGPTYANAADLKITFDFIQD